MSSKALVLVSFALLARTLGSDGFGKLAWAQAIVGYLSIPADFGIATFATRAIASQPATVEWYLRRVPLLRLGLALTVVSLTVAGVWSSGLDAPLAAVLIASVCWLIPNMASLEWLAQGSHRVDLLGLSRFVNGAALLGLVFFWTQLSGSLVSAAWLRVAAEAAAAVCIAVVALRTIRRPAMRAEGDDVAGIFRQSAPLLGATVFTSLYAANFDIVVLGMLAPESEVGLYAAAFRLYLMVVVIPKLVLVQYFPRFAAAAASAPTLLERVREFQGLVVRLALPPILLLWVLAPEVIVIVFGPEYLDGARLIRILCIGAVAVTLGASGPSALMASGQSTKALWCFASAMIVNIVGNLALVPTFGAYGAALAVVISEVVVLLLGYTMLSGASSLGTANWWLPDRPWDMLWIGLAAVTARIAVGFAGFTNFYWIVVLTSAAVSIVWLWRGSLARFRIA